MFAKAARCLALIVFMTALLPQSARAEAEAYFSTGVGITVQVNSAFARGVPSLSGQWVHSVFKGETYRVRARTADSQWLQIDSAGSTGEVWIMAAWGTVAGGLDRVPVAAPATAAAKATVAAQPAAAFTSEGVLPMVSSRAREIYHLGLSLGNNPHAFSKVGDCLSVPPFFLASFDDPRLYRLGAQYASLQETIDNFAGSFARPSQSARIGISATGMLDPIWADARQCQRGETPLACEVRLHRPSLAFVSLGTNGAWLTDAEYESALRQIITFLIEHGVVPILATKADQLDGGVRFNQIVTRLAAEYQVPLWDYALAVKDLPNHGLMDDGAHPRWAPSDFDDPAQIWSGWQYRNLTALQALDRVWRAVR